MSHEAQHGFTKPSHMHKWADRTEVLSKLFRTQETEYEREQWEYFVCTVPGCARLMERKKCKSTS